MFSYFHVINPWKRFPEAWRIAPVTPYIFIYKKLFFKFSVAFFHKSK